jgi:hypothetical protein
MPLPPAHFLVGAAAAEIGRTGSSLPPKRVWLVGGIFGLLPDMDKGVGILLGVGSAYQGVFTHSFVAVLLVAGSVWLASGRRWALIAGLAYASHLIADVMEDRTGTSVQPFWPFTDRTLHSLVPFFPRVPWRHGRGPEEAALSLFHPDVLPWLIAQTAVALGVFVLTVLVGRFLLNGSRRVEEQSA